MLQQLLLVAVAGPAVLASLLVTPPEHRPGKMPFMDLYELTQRQIQASKITCLWVDTMLGQAGRAFRV